MELSELVIENVSLKLYAFLRNDDNVHGSLLTDYEGPHS